MSETEQCRIPECLKVEDVFSFKITNGNRITTDSTYTVASPCGKFQIFVNGAIYSHNEGKLARGFSSHGIDFVKQLEGSFVIFLIKKDIFYILTDKINSKKAFYAFIDDVWHVSNNVDALPKNKCQLDLDGIACFLANGVMLNELTIFQEIRSAKRASIHKFQNQKLFISTYWDFVFNYSPRKSIDDKQHRKEFERLLINSVKRRYEPGANTAISLSAGYDSRGILGILYNELKASCISCFSYSSADNSNEYSDPMLSKKLAAKCGYPHQVFISYEGNLIAQLTNNAKEGKCLSNFCDELDAWHNIREYSFFSDIFVGDMCFGDKNVPFGSREDILDTVFITGAPSIRWLKSFIRKDLYNAMCQCLDSLIDVIFERTANFTHTSDKRDYLYLDQRISNGLMPWRENFTSQIGFVHNPYLDGEILECVGRMPPKNRKNKSFFRKTVSEMFTDLFLVKLATSSGHSVDWLEELDKNRDDLIELVEKSDSRLDDLIQKEEFKRILAKKISVADRFAKRLRNASLYIREKHRIIHMLVRFVLPWFNKFIRAENPDTLILRLLLLRIYLTPTSRGN